MRRFLLNEQVSSDLISMVEVLGSCSVSVQSILAQTSVRATGTSNTFGDEQLSVDVLADCEIFSQLRDSNLVEFAASEEEPVLRTLSTNGKYTVCFDPLDGSSIVDCNWAVGSIFGVWPKGELKNGENQVLSVITVYGPRLTMIIGIKEKNLCFETCFIGGEWELSERKISISPEIKIFSPANLKSSRDLPGYAMLITEWMERKLTLRYTGGMVPDVGGILVKKGGIFASPVSRSAPAKLRLVFECAPIALIIELADGLALTQDGTRVLDIGIEGMDQRTGMICGSHKEVEHVIDMLKHSVLAFE